MESSDISPSGKYPELERVIKNLLALVDKLMLTNAETTEIVAPNNKLTATVALDKGYVRARIYVTLSKVSPDEICYTLHDYPLTQISSILSIISPLLPKLKFLSQNPEYLTPEFTKDAIQDLRQCESILTVRNYITNSEYLNDWNTSFEPQLDPLQPISIFIFRAAIYVTVFQLEETSKSTILLQSDPSPFNYSQGSILKIDKKNYLVKHSIVASQNLQFLAEVLRYLRESIQELRTLTDLKAN